ncbi:MAG TPA: IS110 family transposase [Vicinamibacteria bacterium]|jgi:transposase|nr:IS110 family transposase [Vicinamibacteria bacterium]
MERVFQRCCGLDVHKMTVAACIRIPGKRGRRDQEVRTFGTTTRELLELRDWLEANGVTHVAMESTGIYWKPIFYVLEGSFTCLLANAAHIAQVPGRKTDVKDCVWIAQLLEHGLLRGSFVPEAPIRDLRDLTRYRKGLVHERTRISNRLHKVLEDAGIKLASVATRVLGASGRAMMEALVGGTTDPTMLADLAQGRLREKLPALREALTGRFRAHHAFLVSQLLAHVDYLDEAIQVASVQIETLMAPFASEIERLDTIPGVNRRTAEVLIAETGADMSRFPTAKHLASWAGLCPGNNESAGKRMAGTVRKGNRWLRTALVEAALSASRAKDSALAARYRRVMRHRGHKKAVIAVAHAILISTYYILARQVPYQELGPDYFDQHHAERARRRALQTLERQGYKVTIEPAA